RYDDAGGIIGIADLTNQYSSGPDDQQCMRYDHLRRLTEAWTPASGNCATAPGVAGLGGAVPYWQSWSYDLTGSRISQVDHAAAGDTTQTSSFPAAGQPGAHQVRSVTTTGPGPPVPFGNSAMGTDVRFCLPWDRRLAACCRS